MNIEDGYIVITYKEKRYAAKSPRVQYWIDPSDDYKEKGPFLVFELEEVK